MGEKRLASAPKNAAAYLVRLALAWSATVQNELNESGKDHVIQANVLVQ